MMLSQQRRGSCVFNHLATGIVTLEEPSAAPKHRCWLTRPRLEVRDAGIKLQTTKRSAPLQDVP